MTHPNTPRHTGRAGAALLCLLASTALAPLTLLPLQAHAGPLAFDAALQQLQQRSDQLAASRNAVESAQLRRDAWMNYQAHRKAWVEAIDRPVPLLAAVALDITGTFVMWRMLRSI